MNIEQSKIEQAVIDRAAETIVESFQTETELVKIVEEKIQALVVKRVDEQLTAHIEKYVNDISMPQTNFFGEVTKSPMTLREFIDKNIKDHLHEEVDRDGKVCKDHYSYKQPRMHWLVKSALGDHIRVSVEQAAAAIRNEIATTMSGIVKKEIEELVGRIKSR